MKNKIIAIIMFLVIGFNSNAQTKDLPPNPKPGICYIKCYSKQSNILKWKEVNCRLTKIDSLSIRKTQNELIKFGYQIESNGTVNIETIDAYNHFKENEKVIRREFNKRKKEKK